MAKPLTREEIEVYCAKLRAEDLQYADSLNFCQSVYLKSKPRIKNWQEFKTVEDIKRVMIGLHDKVELSGTVTHIIKTSIDV
ncbi:MAG: hypothetical protein KGJ01_02930 [Patescibacteria group bacterium]|nr:hypothetical protein [Patescibacteria group bacterium]